MSELNPLLKKELITPRVLLAEGDQIHLAVLKHLLKKKGFSFDLANNGSEILTMVNQSDYDLVIIDLEHQANDAYQTVVNIRTNNNSKISQLSVIGITNNSDPLILKKYADAGANNYLLRPVKLDELSNAIDAIAKDKSDFDTTEVQTKSPLLNLNMLYATCGNSETVNNILKLFIVQTPDNMKQLDEFFKAGDWDGFKNLSHNMKSIYSLIGLADIKKNFDEMEKDCANQIIDIPKFEKYLLITKKVNATVIDEMNKILLAK